MNESLFNNEKIVLTDMNGFIVSLFMSVIAGILVAIIYKCSTKGYTYSFMRTLLVIPAITCMIIIIVNGNIGTGIAVAGAFSLVRFRSKQGTAYEIGIIFFAMSIGMVVGTGYYYLSIIYILFLGIILILFNKVIIRKGGRKYKILRITIPENLNYSDVFKEILYKYTIDFNLSSVRTCNMGSMFKLTYIVLLKTEDSEKELIDVIRCRNGNLEIQISDSTFEEDNL